LPRSPFTRGLFLLAALSLTACSAAATTAPTAMPTDAEELPPPAVAATANSAPSAGPTQAAVAGALPGNMLIADRGNNRVIEVNPQGQVVWQFPRPGDLLPGQYFHWPDDAFYGPDGRSIVIHEEEAHVIVLVDYLTHRIVWQYGVADHHGSANGYLNGPDDAYLWPDGSISVADIRNCRVLLIDRSSKRIKAQLGRTGFCLHQPPRSFGMPNGDTPLANGQVLITEIFGSWVSQVSWQGRLAWSVRAPGIHYPSDAHLTAAGNVLLVDYARPGQILMMSPTGRVIWRYAPRFGAAMLDHPSLGIELSNGLIALNDDFRDRVLIIDPKTNRIVWQYGVTDRPGRGRGLLFIPDGIDIKPAGWGQLEAPSQTPAQVRSIDRG
jgi:outer membrane protein assembly factor BamB